MKMHCIYDYWCLSLCSYTLLWQTEGTSMSLKIFLLARCWDPLLLHGGASRHWEHRLPASSESDQDSRGRAMGCHKCGEWSTISWTKRQTFHHFFSNCGIRSLWLNCSQLALEASRHPLGPDPARQAEMLEDQKLGLEKKEKKHWTSV